MASGSQGRMKWKWNGMANGRMCPSMQSMGGVGIALSSIDLPICLYRGA